MYLLTELIRLLEQQGHTFIHNPHHINQQLRQTTGDDESKLYRRAILLDSNGQLNHQLNQTKQHLHLLKLLATIIWFILGFSSTYGIMQHTSLNFFFILVATLGLNTLMLLIWLMNTLFQRPYNLSIPLFLFNKNTPIQQAILQLYFQQNNLPHARYQRGIISHQMALSALTGMLIAALMLLSFRQYTFNWESTLLNEQTFSNITAALSWLPEKLGFPVPNETAVFNTRNQQDITHAAHWGSLLLGSLFCYGILPRLVAWIWCRYQIHRHPAKLNLKLPYYQNIIQQWHYRITDSSEDYQADKVITAPSINLHTDGEHWAVLLDREHSNPNWYQHQLGQSWQNKGILADRHQIKQFIETLQQHPVQLLIGVHVHHVPDRGLVRTLQRLLAASQHGIIIQFLLSEPSDKLSGSQQTILEQWRQTCQQHQWPWQEPLT